MNLLKSLMFWKHIKKAIDKRKYGELICMWERVSCGQTEFELRAGCCNVSYKSQWDEIPDILKKCPVCNKRISVKV
jgi:hypothetical protein